MENVGYGLGALANASDFLAGANPGEVQLVTENSDKIGHSAITEVGETDPYNSIVSVGPDESLPKNEFLDPTKFHEGTNNWKNYVDNPDATNTVIVKGVNVNRLRNYGNSLGNNVNYNVYCSSCVSHASRALTISGIPTVGMHPSILYSQIYLRSVGIRPGLYSYYLYR